jgi:hypothetical protein
VLPCRPCPPVCCSCVFFLLLVQSRCKPRVLSRLRQPLPLLKLDYPDSTAGLEHLVEDIIKAQKANAGDRAEALLQSLVLPPPRAWYDMAFGTSVAEESKSIYEQSGAGIPNSMAQFLLLQSARA